jgi:hypothetical protein
MGNQEQDMRCEHQSLENPSSMFDWYPVKEWKEHVIKE